MSEKTHYRTRQMTMLLSYLESVRGHHITVNDVKDYFKNQGVAIGTATIYRHLEKMEEQGTVLKYVVDNTSSACFEYVGSHEIADQPSCFHCKCEKCGRLIHLHCTEAENLRLHLFEKHGFKMDSIRTVFYGICDECGENSR